MMRLLAWHASQLTSLRFGNSGRPTLFAGTLFRGLAIRVEEVDLLQDVVPQRPIKRDRRTF